MNSNWEKKKKNKLEAQEYQAKSGEFDDVRIFSHV